MSVLCLVFLLLGLYHHFHTLYGSTQSNHTYFGSLCSRTLNDKGGCYFLTQSGFKKKVIATTFSEGLCLTGKRWVVEAPGSGTVGDKKVSGSRLSVCGKEVLLFRLGLVSAHSEVKQGLKEEPSDFRYFWD